MWPLAPQPYPTQQECDFHGITNQDRAVCRPGRRSWAPVRGMGDHGGSGGHVDRVQRQPGRGCRDPGSAGRRLRRRRGRWAAQAPVRADLRQARRSPSGPGHREGAGAAAQVRPAGRFWVRRRRRRRIRYGFGRPRADSDRIRFGRGFPQRRLRHLPWLPALPADRASASIGGPRVITTKYQATERISSMARSDVLVTTDWAESNLDAPNTVFVEVDEDASAYDGGHIAGAVKLDWKTDLQDAVKRDFVDAQQFSKLLSDRGISNDDTVILYGGNNNWFAAYAFWYFKLYGHQKVKLLDGGRKKWELDGRPLSRDAVNRSATSYVASAPDNNIRAFRDEVIAAIGEKN